MSNPSCGMLVLENGAAFPGHSLGAEGEFVGEVVFNTSMTGYQEIITDASYWGQMVVFTCPHIGNVGVNAHDAESRRPWVRAVIARQLCAQPSNWRAEQPLPAYLREYGIPALSGVDTRRLTLTLRDKGVMRGALVAGGTAMPDPQRLRELALAAPDMSEQVVVQHVATTQVEPWCAPVEERWRTAPAFASDSAPHIVVMDCGIKHNILRLLVTFGARVTVVPPTATFAEIMALDPAGVLLGNGPGDPTQVPPQTIATIRALLGRVPLFGLCLGHQLIALACGARTFKLPFGHHAGNQPVLDGASALVEITAQNHNYAVDEASLAGLPLEVTHRNLNDHTVEGMRHTHWPITSVQHHPEASPGPHDSLHLLRAFVQSCK